jgi:SET family sugar efflux transporter-like MFS transporter
MWWLVMPRDFAKPGGAVQEGGPYRRNRPLLLAAGVCLAFAMAHSMSMSALPLYYIREAGLPAYAPGISLSVKTLVEIAAILATPLMMAWLGARNALRLAAVLAVAAFVVLSRVTTLPQLVFGAALEGLYYGIFAAIGLTYMQDFARGRLARATSLYMNSLFVGGVLASPMMGLVAQFVSFGAAIQLASVWAVLGFGVLTYMSPGRLEQ